MIRKLQYSTHKIEANLSPLFKDDNEAGLRILARIIARAHLTKKGHTRTTNDEQNSIIKQYDGAKQ